MIMMVATRSVMVVSLVMSMTFLVQVNGQTNTTTACEAAFRENCASTDTNEGAVQCCAFLKEQYENDLSCLCHVLSESTEREAVDLLEACSIDTGGTSPCSDSSSPVPGSPTPPSFVPSPPTVFATPSPPVTPATFNAPSPPAVTNSPTLGRNNGAPASSFLAGMIGVGVTYALIFLFW